MPWLTPDATDADKTCRRLLIPENSVWLALVSGALTELTLKYNWQKFGDMTVDETVAAMRAIIDGYYDDGCDTCELPGGGKIIRIGAHGHIEELTDGAWGEPTGDYVIPLPSAREGDEPDIKCLAAKNATNVLQQLYENLSESWDAHLSEAEAGTEFIVAAVAVVGFEFAPITFGIIAFFQVVFGALYAALEYLGSDLWDENFTSQMECFLFDCAVVDAGVVTFDWDCFMAKLNSLTDSFGLSEIQLRLYLQVAYILYFIGGVDGLNLAGGTTEIIDDDCSGCDLTWCYVIRMNDLDYDFTTIISGTPEVYGLVTVYDADPSKLQTVAQVRVTLPMPGHVTRLTQTYLLDNIGSSPIMGMQADAESVLLGYTSSFGTGTGGFDVTGDFDYDDYTFFFVPARPENQAGQGWIQELTLRGTGENPFGNDNCF